MEIREGYKSKYRIEVDREKTYIEAEFNEAKIERRDKKLILQSTGEGNIIEVEKTREGCYLEFLGENYIIGLKIPETSFNKIHQFAE